MATLGRGVKQEMFNLTFCNTNVNYVNIDSVLSFLGRLQRIMRHKNHVHGSINLLFW